MFKELFFDALWLAGTIFLIDIIFELIMFPFRKITEGKIRNEILNNIDKIMKKSQDEIEQMKEEKDKK